MATTTSNRTTSASSRNRPRFMIVLRSRLLLGRAPLICIRSSPPSRKHFAWIGANRHSDRTNSCTNAIARDANRFENTDPRRVTGATSQAYWSWLPTTESTWYKTSDMTSSKARITSARFTNYKAFRDYTASFKDFNVLVGPNNAGKSTILGALRILSEGIRKARSRNPEFMRGYKGRTKGYAIDLRGLFQRASLNLKPPFERPGLAWTLTLRKLEITMTRLCSTCLGSPTA
jgi:hypothetical protein